MEYYVSNLDDTDAYISQKIEQEAYLNGRAWVISIMFCVDKVFADCS